MQAIAPLVFALGVAQIVSWGTLFYAVGVLGRPMAAEVGVSEAFVYASFTAALLVSGVFSPWIGRLVDRRGGRLVLAAGSVAAAVAMGLLALAGSAAMLLGGWILVGAAMACCLYDPAFATLSQHTGARYRKAVTALTIFGGFASTVFWPLSHIMLDAWGWRITFACYGALHLFLCLPIHLLFVPRRLQMAHPAAHAVRTPERPAHRRGLWLLTIAFAAASFASAVVAVHVIGILSSKGLSAAQAISLAMLFGPMQVAGRLAEFGFAARVRVAVMGLLAMGLLVFALAALLFVDGLGIAAIAFIVAYGLGNGLFTIIRGTVPEDLYGRVGLGEVLGNLARAGLLARALAPGAFSGLLAIGLTGDAALATVCAVAAAGLASYALAIRRAGRGIVRPG